MPKIKNVPFQFTNEAVGGKHILTLSGNIRKKYWSDEDVIDAKTIRSNLDGITDDIVIKLNSPGGDVFEGIEIYNYLKDHPSNIIVEVTGLAASAATFITSGADKVIMNIGTSLMIHEASTFAWGNKQEIAKRMKQLETIDDSILAIYSDKTSQSTNKLRDWMEEEKWFSADEAVEFGFADEVKSTKKEEKDIEDIVNAQVAQAMASFFNSKNDHAPINIEEQTGIKGSKLISKNQSKSLVARLKRGE
ncbi:head maturation protease, ClpP-related [Enterococcus sp. AZ189]|uniref:head maturation protease, ClpP-related n=1 Tax=Enterococcus sp. AZ189 TaxID=2774871 RepID=UPI003F23902B